MISDEEFSQLSIEDARKYLLESLKKLPLEALEEVYNKTKRIIDSENAKTVPAKH